jgi:hypothetical protein
MLVCLLIVCLHTLLKITWIRFDGLLRHARRIAHLFKNTASFYNYNATYPTTDNFLVIYYMFSINAMKWAVIEGDTVLIYSTYYSYRLSWIIYKIKMHGQTDIGFFLKFKMNIKKKVNILLLQKFTIMVAQTKCKFVFYLLHQVPWRYFIFYKNQA